MTHFARAEIFALPSLQAVPKNRAICTYQYAQFWLPSDLDTFTPPLLLYGNHRKPFSPTWYHASCFVPTDGELRAIHLDRQSSLCLRPRTKDQRRQLG